MDFTWRRLYCVRRPLWMVGVKETGYLERQ
jgi:hypothetical protein